MKALVTTFAQSEKMFRSPSTSLRATQKQLVWTVVKNGRDLKSNRRRYPFPERKRPQQIASSACLWFGRSYRLLKHLGSTGAVGDLVRYIDAKCARLVSAAAFCHMARR